MISETGKVAKILGSRTVALNLGKKQGVSLGMTFQIFSNEAKVVDPDTGTELGVVRLPKVKVRVVSVEELYSVAETFEYKTVNKGGQGMLSSVATLGILEPPRLVREYVTFGMTKEQQDELKEEKSTVKVGDTVELLSEVED